MKLRANKLKELAEARGVTLEQLAGAAERPGLQGDAAVSAVRNWMMGRNHPRAGAADIERLASALGVQLKDIAAFVSMVRDHRGSPKKAKLVTDLIQNRGVDEARDMLRFSSKRAAVNVLKALDAAAADAEQFGADYTELVVIESRIDGAQHIKRFQPKDRGRAHPILKRTSHITVGVAERSSARR